MKKVLVALLSTGGLLLTIAGCGSNKEGGAEPAGTAAVGDKIGVAECDEYVAKYSACIAKAPSGPMKTAAEQGLKDTKAAWHRQAASPAGKESMKAGCKAQLDGLPQNPICK